MNPFTAFRRQIYKWVAERTPRRKGPVEIVRRRIYIVPTRFGYGFVVLLVVLTLAAMNYTNSLLFVLAFWMAGMGLVAMHRTHANLLGLVIDGRAAGPVFAGDEARVRVEIANPSGVGRYAVQTAWAAPDQGLPSAASTVSPAAGGRETNELPLPALERGRLPQPRFAISSEYPLGLFTAWTYIELDLASIVWPKPAAQGLGSQPSDAETARGEREGRRSGADSFTGLKPFQPGDSQRRIHWKSVPRVPVPLVKQFSETAAAERWLDFSRLPERDPEVRLSRLARAILDAEEDGAAWGLLLPGQPPLGPASGIRHRDEGLDRLALFGLKGLSGKALPERADIERPDRDGLVDVPHSSLLNTVEADDGPI